MAGGVAEGKGGGIKFQISNSKFQIPNREGVLSRDIRDIRDNSMFAGCFELCNRDKWGRCRGWKWPNCRKVENRKLKTQN